MDLGIIGFQRSGKTTVFNAVTRGHAETGAYGAGVQPNIGVVKVPDERLDRLAALFNPKKLTHADIRYVDFPGAAPHCPLCPTCLPAPFGRVSRLIPYYPPPERARSFLLAIRR